MRPSSRLLNAMKTVIVTGANRGIGKAICNLILSNAEIQPVKLLATTRQGTKLDFDSKSNGSQVLFPKLDISSKESIHALADEVKREHGSIDVLINNAGINLDNEYGPENARKTLDVNYRGTLEMCQTLIPLLSAQGRIVNLSSVASSLKAYDQDIQARFRSSDMTLQDLEHLAQEYQQSVSSGKPFGGPGRSYSFSKACVNAFTAVLAREHAKVTINACCPGWVQTDMGRLVGKPPKSDVDGAKIPVRLAFGDLGGVSGRYWANDGVRSKEEGKVQEW